VGRPDFATSERLWPGPNDLPKAIGLFIVQIGVAWVAWLIFVLTTLSIAGCGDRCDYALAGTANDFQIRGSIALLAATLLAAILLRVLHRPAWWAPAVGIVLTILLSVGTTLAMRVATSVG
jgi:hypothetical protein